MTTEASTASDDAQIRQLIDRWTHMIRAKDLDGVMAFYSSDIISFDLEPPLQYVRRKNWQNTFAAYGGPMGYEVRDLSVTVGGDVAFSHSLNRASGTLKNGKPSTHWVRWTACFCKIDGKWLIVHDHISVPVDLEHGKALLDLTP